jgi:hypothetical protein
MNYKTSKLISVLSIAALLLILALLVANVTSCAPLTQSAVAASTTTQPIHDGTIYHPWLLDPDASGQQNWNVTTYQGVEFWAIRPGSLGHARIGDDVLYNNNEYQIEAIDRKALTMNAAILGN